MMMTKRKNQKEVKLSKSISFTPFTWRNRVITATPTTNGADNLCSWLANMDGHMDFETYRIIPFNNEDGTISRFLIIYLGDKY